MIIFCWLGILILVDLLINFLERVAKKRFGSIALILCLVLVAGALFIVSSDYLVSTALGLSHVVLDGIINDFLFLLLVLLGLDYVLKKKSLFGFYFKNNRIVYDINENQSISLDARVLKKAVVLEFLALVIVRLSVFYFLFYRNLFVDKIVALLIILLFNFILIFVSYLLDLKKEIENLCIEMIFWDRENFSLVIGIIDDLKNRGYCILSPAEVDKNIKLFYELGIFYSSAVDFSDMIEKGYRLKMKPYLLEAYIKHEVSASFFIFERGEIMEKEYNSFPDKFVSKQKIVSESLRCLFQR